MEFRKDQDCLARRMKKGQQFDQKFFSRETNSSSEEEKCLLFIRLNGRLQKMYKEILQTDYLLSKIGFDTAENEPSNIWYMGMFRFLTSTGCRDIC